jgi:hypothetical protein
MEDNMHTKKNCQSNFSTCLEDMPLAATRQQRMDQPIVDSMPSQFPVDGVTLETGKNAIGTVSKMTASIMQLHRCEDCPIRRRAMVKPQSFFAAMHRWHKTWWPGWKIYRAEHRANTGRLMMDNIINKIGDNVL